MPLADSTHIPGSTYRLQLHGGFTFAQVGDLVPYFTALGVTDLYFSPILAATPGSQHGYDVTDYGTINPELGGSDGFDLLAGKLRAANFGVLVDFVPNHMGIGGVLNEWWRDVLEHGRLSPYEGFFDIQWNERVARGRPRVLVPLLEDHYGKVLEQGKISLTYEKDYFALRYYDLSLPVNPACYAAILAPLGTLGPDNDTRRSIAAIVAAFAALPGDQFQPDPVLARKRADEVTRLKADTAALIGNSEVLRTHLAARLHQLNGTPGDAASFAALHELIEQQHYRLARWKTGAHEINYRRFFAIDTLVGLHMERPEVFRACHELLGRLVREGKVAGLRIDHIDGLRQPEDYLRRLQSLERPDNAKPLYVLVEKILARGEALPTAWPVHGTTGYEFIPQVGALFTDVSTESKFDELYRRFTGDTANFGEIVHQKKRLIIAELFFNAASNLGAELVTLLEGDRHWRDLTQTELTNAVTELMANLAVYRTYRRRQEPVTPQDRRVIEDACRLALARNSRADPQPFEFIRDLLIGTYPDESAPAEFRAALLKWVLTFQQYTGAVMAKAVEDTAFYTYNRLVALNEVGGTAEYADGSAAAFHHANLHRLAHAPHSMLTTSTHDTKLSEDVRARLYALSELPGEWQQWLSVWRGLTAQFTTQLEGAFAPDTQDLYRFFQVLLGVWPLQAEEVNDALRLRLREYFRKAVNEAKRHTSILQANEAYLAACDRFVDGLLTPGSAPDFLQTFVPCARRIARLGCINSLTQTVLKFTVPGVPDLYQGNETWDFSLVDPDNRREVDYAHRQRLLREIAPQPLNRLLENWRSGGIKLRVTQGLLTFRRDHPELFARGDYQAVTVRGELADHVVAFTRQLAEQTLLVVVPRLTAQVGTPPLGAVWEDTHIVPAVAIAGWRDLFKEQVLPGLQPLYLRTLFSDAPFAVLHGLTEKRGSRSPL